MEKQQVEQIEVSHIKPSKTNPRRSMNEVDTAELMDSIQEKGIQYPLTVRVADETNVFEIVDGERRYTAAKALQLETIPCIIVEMTDQEAFDAQLISHLQRKNIHPMEEAAAFHFLAKEKKFALSDIAKISGKKADYIHQRMNLVALSKKAKEHFSKNVLTLDHAMLLARMTEDDQEKALQWLIAEEFEYDTQFARPLESFKQWIAEEISFNLANAPWDKTDGELIPGVVACTLCPKNSAYNTTLFPEDQGKGVCQDRACFKAKLEAYKLQQHKKARKEEKLGFLLISSKDHINEDDPLKIKGVKMHGRFKIVQEKTKCENTNRAQWIDGKDRGKFVLICNYSKCPKHWKGSSSRSVSRGNSGSVDSYNSPANVLKRRKARNKQVFEKMIELESRNMIVTVALSKIPSKIDLKIMRTIVAALSGTGVAGERYIARRHGLEFNAEKGGIDESQFVKKVEKANERELIELIHELLWENIFDPWGLGSSKKEVDAIAAQFKIDQKALRKLATKHVTTDLHHCEVCSCTEKTACEEKCSWVKEFLDVKRYVCSQCTSLAKPIVKKEAKKAAA